MDDTSKRQGKVKFYDATRGFGFISPDDDPPELFFHATGIDDACEFEPEPGDAVEFVAGVDRKGRAAATRWSSWRPRTANRRRQQQRRHRDNEAATSAGPTDAGRWAGAGWWPN